jgi:hypothetical protein
MVTLDVREMSKNSETFIANASTAPTCTVPKI